MILGQLTADGMRTGSQRSPCRTVAGCLVDPPLFRRAADIGLGVRDND